MHNQRNFAAYHQNHACITGLMNGEADGGKWIVDWMKYHLKAEALETINAVQISR
jgi:hypothetical protein